MANNPFDVKNTVRTTQAPFGFAQGINNTAVEQNTSPNELVAGQNVFTDVLGGVYNRRGSFLLGGIASTSGSLGTYTFKDNNQRQVVIQVIDDTIYYTYGGALQPIPGSPKLPSRLPVSGVFFPDVNQFILANGTDNNVVIAQSASTLTATADSTMQKCKYLGYLDHHVYFLNLPGFPNQFALSDYGATSRNALSVVSMQGMILGMEQFDLATAAVLTDQRIYRVSYTNRVTNENDGTFSYSPQSIDDIGPSRGVAPRSLKYVHGSMFWVGYDDVNGVEIYRTEGQTVQPIGGYKIKYYLNTINTSSISQACATGYGPYYKVAVPSSGSSLNTMEILLDARRSLFFENPYTAAQANPIFEPKHVSGYAISQYCTFNTSGQDFVLAADQSLGCIHRQGINYSDEQIVKSTFPAVGSALNVVVTSVTDGSPLGQPFSFATDTYIRTLFVKVGTVTNLGTFTLSIQTDVSGFPSGTPLNTFSQGLITASQMQTNPAGASVSFSNSVKVPAGQRVHLVGTATGGTFNVITVASQLLGDGPLETLTNNAWQKASGTTLGMILTADSDIESFAVQTTNFEEPRYKKKLIQTIVNGSSVLGSAPTLGIGIMGRDSTFTEKPINLSGNSSLWGAFPPDGNPAVLTWAADPSNPGQYQTWGSLSTLYGATVFAPIYQKSSTYLTFRFYQKGQTDWRINSYVPFADIIPSTLI